MLPVLTALGLGILSGTTGVVTPGPVTFLVIQQSAQRGMRGGFLVITAHAMVGFLLFLAIAFSGVRVFFQTLAFQVYTALIGGIALVVLGVILMRSRDQVLSSDAASRAGTPGNPFIGGIIVSVANPQVFLWWGTIGTTLIGEAYTLAGGWGLAAWSGGGLMVLFLWYGVISFLVARGAGRISPAWIGHVTRASGILLIVMGVWFIFSVCALPV